MSRNLVALLIAGALILLSALEITYMSTKSTEFSKQVTLRLDESKTKRLRPRAVISVQGLPTQIGPGSLAGRVVQPGTPREPAVGNAEEGALVISSVDADTGALVGNGMNQRDTQAGR